MAGDCHTRIIPTDDGTDHTSGCLPPQRADTDHATAHPDLTTGWNAGD